MKLTIYDTLSEGHRHIMDIPEPVASNDPQLSEYLPTWCEVDYFVAPVERRPVFIREGHPTGFFATTASDGSSVDWNAQLLVEADVSSYPIVARECSASGVVRAHSPSYEIGYASRKVNLLVRNEDNVKKPVVHDVRCCNHFTDAFDSNSSGGETYGGPMYFTHIEPKVGRPKDDDWSAVGFDGSGVPHGYYSFAIGRNIWDSTLECWRPAVGINALVFRECVVDDPTLTEIQAELQDKVDYVLWGLEWQWNLFSYELEEICGSYGAPMPTASIVVGSIVADLVGDSCGAAGAASNDVPFCQ